MGRTLGVGFAFATAFAVACTSTSNTDSGTCTTTPNGDGTATIVCPDGTRSVVGTPQPTPSSPNDAGPTPGNPDGGGTDAMPGPPEKVLSGDFTIANEIDAKSIADVTKITGSLSINGSAGLAVSLPVLREVGGSLKVGDSGFASLDLPKLEKANTVERSEPTLAGGLATFALPALKQTTFVRLHGPHLQTVSFPVLAGALPGGIEIRYTALSSLAGFEGITSSGKITLYSNQSLASISALAGIKGVLAGFESELCPLASLTGLDGITEVSGAFRLSGGSLSSLAPIQGLTKVGAFSLSGNPALTTVVMPELAALTTGTLRVGSTQATLVSFPKLVTLPTGNQGYLMILNNPNLTTLDFPLLTTLYGFDIESNALLTTLGLPSLVTAISQNTNEVFIGSNASLKSCLVTALGQQLQPARTIGGTGSNNTSGTCP